MDLEFFELLEKRKTYDLMSNNWFKYMGYFWEKKA